MRSFVIALIIIGIFYLSWIPDSHFTSESYLPLWLRDWCNSFFNLRTAIPFIPFGFFLEAVLQSKDGIKTNFKCWFANLFLSTLVVSLAEGGQFFILNRHPDVMDVFYGILGSQLGFFIHYILHEAKKFRTRLSMN